jgi:hypothetical protein
MFFANKFNNQPNSPELGLIFQLAGIFNSVIEQFMGLLEASIVL